MKTWTVSMVCVVLALTGCASLSNEIQPDPRGDTVIATRIKTKLIDAPELAAAAINVARDRGIVTLTGFVESEPQFQQAETMANTTPGVRRVINRLEVKW